MWTPGKLPPDQIPCRAFSKSQSALMSNGKEKTKYRKVTKSNELWGPGNLKELPYLACQSKDQRKLGVGATSQSWNRGQVFGLFLASSDIEYNR